MKMLKYAVLALAGVLVLAGALFAYVAATFDPNQYKPQLVQAVKDRTQRTLKLEGDIALSFWPSIGAKIGKASLSERGSEKEFAQIAEAHVSLKLLPLLSRQVVADTVRVKGLRANVVKTKDGRTNMDDLTGAPPPKEAPAPKEAGLAIDIAGVVIEDATVTYTDQAAGTAYTLSNLDLKSGRITPGVPTKLDLKVHAQSKKPVLDLQAALKTELTFVPGKSVSLKDLDLDAKGAAAGITGLVVKATGSAAANVESGELTTEKLKVSLQGQSGKDALDVKIEAPKVHVAADKATGDQVSIELGLKGADLDLKAKMVSPLTGNIKAQQVSLPQLKASITASGPNLPGKSIAGELAGSAAVDGTKQTAKADLAGKIADSNIKAQFNIADFTPLAVSFNLDVDQLDVDRYLPPKTADAGKGNEGKGKGAAASPQPGKPFDLTALRNLKANGKMHFGSLKANNVKASNVRVDVKAGGGRVDLSPLTASLYQGTLSSAISINAAPAVPTFTVKHNMSGINIGPFLQDLASNDTLEGKANITIDATTQGNTVSAMKKAINGKAGMKVTDGAIKGIDIPGAIRGVRSQLGALRGEKTQPADKRQKTDFSELSATFDIKNGVAHNNDLAMKSPLLRAAGEGDINIGEDTINYLLKASLVGSLQGQGGRGVEDLKDVTIPVRLTGALDSPSYKLDFSAAATAAAKQRVGDEIQKRLGIGGGASAGSTKTDDAKKGAEKSSGSSTREAIRGILGR
jgi:AsmA protein